jgi:hypothetical protein
MQQAVAPKRPLGITILAALVAIQGALLLYLAIVGLFLVVLPGWTAATGGGPTGARIITLVVGLFYLLLAAASFYLAYGLWGLKRRAFLGVVIVKSATIIFILVGLFGSDGERGLQGLIIPVIVLLYFLFNPRVRAAFRF